MENEILDKFTTHLRNVLARSYALAVEAHALKIRPIHLLLALSLEKGSIGADLLQKIQFDAGRIRSVLAKDRAKKTAATGSMPSLSAGTKKIIEKSVLIASIHEHTYVGTEHLLSGLLQVADPELQKLFELSKTNTVELEDYLNAIFMSTSKFPEMNDAADYLEGVDMMHEGHAFDNAIGGQNSMHAHPTTPPLQPKKQESKTPALDFFTTDLTNKESQANTDPMIGREKEVERIIQILSRRSKNNPLLLGDPGVGKTAIVEGLAQRIAQKNVPDALIGKRLLSLDLGLVVAGTMYRGEFEARIKQIVDEISTNKEIILFIDEIHTIIGAGSSNGSMDAANMLKPALARGVFKCIGATTEAEYKKHIESDAALERRMQPIHIYEPDEPTTVAILMGIKNKYEQFHKVSIENDAVSEAVALAKRYIPERFFPDKAIDVLDEAAAIVGMHTRKSAEKRQYLEAEEALSELETTKMEALTKGDYKRALQLKQHEQKLKNKKYALKRRMSRRESQSHGNVTVADIQRVVSQMTGVPLSQLQDSERAKLNNLESELMKRVIGQDHVIRDVAQSIRRARLGLSNPNRPLASFLFVGPSGVGKTELAKAIAHHIFGADQAFVRVDMSEFRENFNMSKLIGAPAGYVGYKEENRLTDQVKRRPHCLVLFDEVDKAHPDVLNLLLQLLEDGHITDAGGKKINFKNTVIIMTAMSDPQMYSSGVMGFSGSAKEADNVFARDSEAIKENIKSRFKNELLNRIDKIVIFKPLENKELQKIIAIELKEVEARIAKLGFSLAVSAPLKERLLASSHAPDQGARMVRKIISELIEDPLSNFLVEHDTVAGTTLTVNLKDDIVKVKTTKKRNTV